MLNNLFIRSLTIDWNKVSPYSYLRGIPAIGGLETLDFTKPVTCFVGENGTGKSTLLEAIAVAYGFNPEGGTKNYQFSTYDSHSELCGAIRLTRGINKPGWGYFLRAESFYNVATKEEEYSRGPGGRPQHYHEKSHGESFLQLAQNSFKDYGIYLLDEPEAALSPQRQLTLLMEIHRCVTGGAQFIIATHSPILLGYPDAEILSLDDGAICPCAYEETGSYEIMEMFINNRERLLHNLLEVEKMKCPYCGAVMEKGLIESSEPINFMKEVRFVNQPKESKGEFNLAKPPFGGRALVEVWLCRDCRKMVIDY